MTDTPDFIARKQYEIVMSKSVAQRFRLTDAMVSHSRQLAINRIKKMHPHCSDSELKYLLIEAYYGQELGSERLIEVKQQLLGSS